MGYSRELSTVGLLEERKHAVSKIGRALSMKMVTSDRKRCNTEAKFEIRKNE